MSQGNYFPPSHAPGGRKNRNKQGNRSQPLRAWKGIAERLERDYPPYERPEAITRPLTKTGKPRKRMNTQQREQRNETRRRNKAERSAAEEHQRRSEAAKKGWAKIPRAERTRRAEAGWETRDLRSGRKRGARNSQKLAGEARDYREHRRKPDYGQPYPPGTYTGGNKFPF